MSANSASLVRRDIVTVLPMADHSCLAFLATAISTQRFAPRKPEGASVNTTLPVTTVISALEASTEMR